MAFNENDPRFQREMQRASAKQSMGGSRRIQSVVDAAVTGKHAGVQADKRLQYGRLGLASRLAQAQHAYRMATLANQGRMTGLRERDLGFRESAFDDQMKSGHRDILMSTIMGGLGAAGSFYMGQQRKGEMAKANALEQARHNQIVELMKNARFNSLPYPIHNASRGTTGLGGK